MEQQPDRAITHPLVLTPSPAVRFRQEPPAGPGLPSNHVSSSEEKPMLERTKPAVTFTVSGELLARAEVADETFSHAMRALARDITPEHSRAAATARRELANSY